MSDSPEAQGDTVAPSWKAKAQQHASGAGIPDPSSATVPNCGDSTKKSTPSRSFPGIPGIDVLELLGHGSMGVVYRARQQRLDRLIALKMVLHGEHADPFALNSLRLEAEAIARLQHPNIVQIYEVGELVAPSQPIAIPYLCLEYIDGGSLEEVLETRSLDFSESAKLVESLAVGVQCAHDHQLVHRDLKPSNVLMKADGTPKITDFGIVKRLDQSGQTKTGAVIGTPVYMAPEQAHGRVREIGPTTDVYSLGAILYQCLTGEAPFSGLSSSEVLVQVMNSDPVAPRQLRPDCPEDLETICLKCLHKESSKRYESARDLAEDLRLFQNGEPVLARPTTTWSRWWKWAKRNPAGAALTLGLALAVLVALVLSLWFAQYERTRAKEARENQLIAQAARDQASREAKRAARNEKLAIARASDAKAAEARALAARALTLRSLYGARVNLVKEAWEAGEVTRARSLLESSSPNDGERDLRGWEWHYLESILDGSLRTIEPAHRIFGSQRHSLVSIGPDCASFVRRGDNDALERVSTLTGKPLSRLPYLGVRYVCSSQDRSVLAAGDNRSRIHVWNFDTGAPVLQTLCPSHSQLCLSGNGQRLAVRTVRPKGVQVYEVNTGKVIHTVRTEENLISIALSPEGSSLLGIDRECNLMVWNLAEKKAPRRIQLDGAAFTHAVTSVHGFRIAIGSNRGTLYLVDYRTGQQSKWKAHFGSVGALAFRPDGRRLASGGDDRVIQEWEIAGGQLVRTLRGHSGPVGVVSYSPDGSTLFSSDREEEVKIWGPRAGRQGWSIGGGKNQTQLFSISGDASLAAVAVGFDSEVRDTNTDELVWSHTSKKRVSSVELSPDGLTLAISEYQNGTRLIALETGKEVVRFPESGFLLRFSTDSSRLAFLHGRNEIASYDLATGTPHRLRSPFPFVQKVQLSFDELGRLHLATRGGSVTWDRTKGMTKPVDPWGSEEPVALSRDGTLALTRDLHRRLRLWSLVENKKPAKLEGVLDVAFADFSPDGRRLVTMDSRGTVKLWGTDDGEELWSSLPGQDGGSPCRYLAFSADGKRIVSGHEDGSVRIRQCGPLSPERALQRRVLALQRYYREQGLSPETIRHRLTSNPWFTKSFRKAAGELQR